MNEAILSKLKDSCKFFEGFSDEELVQFVKLMHPRNYKSDDFIFRKSDSAETFFIIIYGEIKIFNKHEAKPLAVLEGGDIFGEMGILLHGNRVSNAKAVQESLLLVISDEILDKESSHLILSKIYKNLAKAVADRYMILAKNHHKLSTDNVIEDEFWSRVTGLEGDEPWSPDEP